MTRIVSARELNRATLARQLLLKRADLDPVTAISRLCALQAQEPASPYLALWTRLADFDPTVLDDAFATQVVVKATLMRMTLHAVSAADYPTLWSALADYSRRARTLDPRFAPTGRSDEEVRQLTGRALPAMDRPRSNAEMTALLDELAGPVPDPGWWWAVRAFAPIVHAPTGGPWWFGRRPSYVAAPTAPDAGDREDSLDKVALSYLAAFGPATVLDLAQFLKLARRPVRATIERLTAHLDVLDGPDGQPLYDVPDGPRPPADTAAPARFLPMWDSVLLAYADRSRIIPTDVRKHVIRQNGDILPTILVDGYVAGVWMPEHTDDGPVIRVTPFHPLDDETWGQLRTEAAELIAFLQPREPGIYRRYLRWWAALPHGQSRALPD